MSRHDLGSLEEFSEATTRSLRVGEYSLVAVRCGERVFVLDNRCSHEDFPLSEGEVDADTCEIECARHGAMFRLDSGAPVSFPATTPVTTYDVVLRNGRVEVELP